MSEDERVAKVVAEVMAQESFLKLRKPLEAKGFKVDFIPSPAGYIYELRTKGSKYYLGAKANFDPSDPVLFEKNGVVLGRGD